MTRLKSTITIIKETIEILILVWRLKCAERELKRLKRRYGYD